MVKNILYEPEDNPICHDLRCTCSSCPVLALQSLPRSVGRIVDCKLTQACMRGGWNDVIPSTHGPDTVCIRRKVWHPAGFKIQSSADLLAPSL